MRTTLTLEDDVAAEVERLRRERDTNLKDIVNEALRRGLAEMQRPAARKAIRIKTFDTGMALIPNIDNVAEILSSLEGDAFK
ncbi:MAG: ribbon-helix-helix protein, CopG family [Parvularculaceae bacterium]|jgi:hypothetical protein|nr:ribbon-helix-helix protein, CopG family [Parvularculaceae bacterium]